MKTCLDCGRVADGSRGTRCKACQARVRRPYSGTAYRATQPGPACTCCGATDDLTRDHIIPLAAGGDNHQLTTLCRACNSSKRDTGACRLEH